jgi:hypothetical protein
MDAQHDALAIHNAKSALRAAFEALEDHIKDGERWRLDSIVDQLADFASYDLTAEMPAPFLDRGRIKTERQLTALANAAEQLAVQLQILNKPAIDALGHEGWLRATLRADCLALAVRARRSDVSGLRDRAKAGRRSGNAARAIAQLVSKSFADLTGRDPQKPFKANEARGINPLVDRVFAILNVQADRRSAIRAAEEINAERGPIKPNRDLEFRHVTMADLNRAHVAYYRELEHIIPPAEGQ